MFTKPQNNVEYLTSERMKGLPFSEAVRVGEMLYLSGWVGVNKDMKLVPGGIAEETRQAMENIKSTLEQFGSSLNQVVKVTVMMADMAEWPEMNKVYVKYFPEHLPHAAHLAPAGWFLGRGLKSDALRFVSG